MSPRFSAVKSNAPMHSPRPFFPPASRPVLTGLAALLSIVLAGCSAPPRAASPTPLSALPASTPESARLDPVLLQTPTEEFTLGPGDRLEIEFVGDTASRATAEVGPDGKIYFNLLPGLDVWGLTLAQTRALIAEKSTSFLREKPDVSITLLEVASKRVWVLGNVNQPGILAMSGPLTLLAAIAESGGPTAADETDGTRGPRSVSADLRRSFVLRRGERLPVDFQRLVGEGDLSQNIYLRPGDFVYVPSASASTVHVLGAVSQPGAVYSGDHLTLIQTIASAGGPTREAYLTHVAVVRGSLSQPTVSVIDYQAVLKGAAPDVELEPRDIVYVPYSPYRTLNRYVDLILRTFVQTVGVNEGAAAVNSDSRATVGVNLPTGSP
jgi:polysaccharide export outer membrane protein